MVFHSLITVGILSLTDFLVQIYWRKSFLPVVKEIRGLFLVFCLFVFQIRKIQNVITESSDLGPSMEPFYRRIFKNI